MHCTDRRTYVSARAAILGFCADIKTATSIVTLVGIYGCQVNVGSLPHTATCWKLSSFSSPTEWVLALCWISYLYAVGYDLYHAEQVREAIIARSSGVEGHSLTRVKANTPYRSSAEPLRPMQPVRSVFPSAQASSYKRISEPTNNDENDLDQQDADMERKSVRAFV